MRRALLAYLILVIFGCILNAKSIWKDRNPYATEGDIKVGTVIVVSINDISDMKFTLSMGNKSNAVVSSSPDVTITGFLPKVAATKKINSDDSTQFTGKGKISFSIATRVLNRVGPM